MRIDNSDLAALYVWDYFYLAHRPRATEARTWGRIECAMFRARESEPFMRTQIPGADPVFHAKRVRRATREVARLIGQLESPVEPWVSEALVLLESEAERVLAESPHASGR